MPSTTLLLRTGVKNRETATSTMGRVFKMRLAHAKALSAAGRTLRFFGMSSMLAKALPDEVIELINLLLVVVRQCVLFSFLAFDEGGFNLKSVHWHKNAKHLRPWRFLMHTTTRMDAAQNGCATRANPYRQKYLTSET